MLVAFALPAILAPKALAAVARRFGEAAPLAKAGGLFSPAWCSSEPVALALTAFGVAMSALVLLSNAPAVSTGK